MSPENARAAMIDGTQVEAGEFEDYDNGRIESIDGDWAFVAWRSGVKTECPLSLLRDAS